MKLNNILPTETILMALQNLRANKFRSFLTVLGIVIGVSTVIGIASLLTGLRQNIVTLVEEYGTNNIFAFHLTTGPQLGPGDRREWKRKPLRLEDAYAIKEQASAVDDVASILFVGRINRTINYQNESYKRGDLQGVTPNYGSIASLGLQQGRFISEFDEQQRREVMVVGLNVVEALFPHRSQVVGTVVEMAGKQFEIIGILDKRKGSFFGENEMDNAVLIPFRTAQKLSPESRWVFLNIRAKTDQLRMAMTQVEDILRRQRGVKFSESNDFDLSTADRMIEQFDGITASIGLIAIALSSIGLLVGGIGVMNIMLVSVTERTKEIGVRKAIGARRRDIVTQFLFEAMTLTFLGGVLGVILAAIVIYTVAYIFPSLPASIPLWAVIAGLLVSVLIGLVFGVWPARKAARLDPIEALRYE